MQNAGLAALGLDWRYLAFEVAPDELGIALRGIKTMGFIGVNLTVPHKVLALPMMDLLDESAATWGAVNTVRVEGKDSAGDWHPLGLLKTAPCEVRLHGFNTDADAITRSLREDLDMELAGARVLLLGAGGAGRTAALKLAAERVGELFLVNRTPSKAEEVARDLRARYPAVTVHLGYPPAPVNLVLNATSLGLKPSDPLPLDSNRFNWSGVRAAYDMVYRPAQTPFLQAAQAAGCRVANGLGMLLYQGAKALELWTGHPAPLDVMRRALRQNVYGDPILNPPVSHHA